MLAGSESHAVSRRWLDIRLFDKQPMRPRLSGLEVEYRILQLFSRDAGKREARLEFNVGQGTQDLGFRSQVDLLFNARAATKVTLRVFDSDDRPTTASFLVRDTENPCIHRRPSAWLPTSRSSRRSIGLMAIICR